MIDERGQTTQDYIVGISIMLLTIAGVFTFVPAVFDTSEDPVQRNAYTQADAVADELISEHNVGGASSTLVYDRLNGSGGLAAGTIAELRSAAGIQRNNLNVTITENAKTDIGAPTLIQDGDRVSSDQPTGTAVRFVQFGNESRCGSDGVCQLIVRVW